MQARAKTQQAGEIVERDGGDTGEAQPPRLPTGQGRQAWRHPARIAGATAALDALKAKTQLRAALRSRLTPGAALDWVSRENRRDDGADLLTAVVMVIELSTGECSYASAGHPPALLTDGDEHRELEPTGPLVGAFPTTWRTDGVTIPPGWLLFVYTDGITDTVGPDRERFGDDRLRDCLDTTDPRSALEEASAEADLLVIGSTGHRGLTRLLLGSVAAGLLHRPLCPTVVVPSAHKAM